jgi:hypothetical protein
MEGYVPPYGPEVKRASLLHWASWNSHRLSYFFFKGRDPFIMCYFDNGFSNKYEIFFIDILVYS